MENKRKHLEMIQAVITRMAGNSFLLKGWAVTLVAGIFALSGGDADELYFLVAYVPILVFWGLDAYYLRQERQYRILYDMVRVKPESEIDFSMKIPPELQNEKTVYSSCFCSITEVGFYLPLALLTSVIIIIA